MDSPGYPPSQQYFIVNGQRLTLLNNKLLIVYKLDNAGTTLLSKNIVELIDVSGKIAFRLPVSWQETTTIFNEGMNRFKFAYGDQIQDDVFINVTFNTNNTLVYNKVQYNQTEIAPVISEKPAANSKLYQIP